MGFNEWAERERRRQGEVWVGGASRSIGESFMYIYPKLDGEWNSSHAYGYVAEERRYKKKNGKPGKSWVFLGRYRFTVLRKCEQCQRVSTPARIADRGRSSLPYKMKEWKAMFADGEDPYEGPQMMCIGCWNKHRALFDKFCQALEIDKMIRKLQEEIRNAKKRDTTDDNGTTS